MRDAFGNNVVPGERVVYYGGGGSGSDLLTPAVGEVLSVTDKTAKVRILEVGREYRPCVVVGQDVTVVPSRLVSVGSLM